MQSFSTPAAATSRVPLPLPLPLPPACQPTPADRATRPEPLVDRPRHLSLAATIEILEELDAAVIVCAEDGGVVFANDAARRELRAGQALRLGADGIVALAGSAAAATLQWRGALRAAVHGGRRQLVRLGTGAAATTASVIPLPLDNQALALVFLGRRQLTPGLAIDMLATHCQLTPAERDVLAALVQGRRVAELALDRGVKVSTLRTQICAIRSKLGAQRLQDFARIASELPPMRSALRSPPLMADRLATHPSARFGPAAGRCPAD